MKIETTDLENDLKRVREEIGKPPRIKEYKKLGKYKAATFIRIWGSWNSALLQIIGGNNKSPPLDEIFCKQCNKKFQQTGRDQIFCSRSCSAKHVNSIHPKRKRTKTCKTCNSLILSGRTYCGHCNKKRLEKILNSTLSTTIGEKRDATKYNIIRQVAIRIMKKEAQICTKCGYSKHVEVCHKKPISTFPPETLVKEINNKDNLMLLCPNCHWEFDHERKVVRVVEIESTAP